MIEIVPAVLESSREAVANRLHVLSQTFTQAQVDFADGEFVNNRLPGIDEVGSINTDLELEAHLMVQRPDSWIDQVLAYPQFATIIFHLEADVNASEAIGRIKAAGRLAGVAIKPETPVSMITSMADTLDMLLVMTIHPGFSGTPFLPETVDKVAEARRLLSDKLIEVDGGVTPQTLPLVAQAGADRAVVGSFLAGPEFEEPLLELQRAVS